MTLNCPEFFRMPSTPIPLFTLSALQRWRKRERGGAKRKEKAIPVSVIQPRFIRAVWSATPILPIGLKRNRAKTRAASTLPRRPARLPKINAVKNSTTLNNKGIQACHERPAARALAARAARAQTSPPTRNSALGETTGHAGNPRFWTLVGRCIILTSSFCRSPRGRYLLSLSVFLPTLGWQNTGLLWEKSRAQGAPMNACSAGCVRASLPLVLLA